MSDHIDGPRQIGDPSADLTDLFAFTSPENPARTVLAANVFPSCGVDAIFSNAVDHSIVVRRAKVASIGEGTKFETSDPEIRFSFRFDTLERSTASQRPTQRGTCALPGGQTLRFVVNDVKGASTPDGAFRVFAGLRSDPFILAWLLGAGAMKPFQNLLFNDNVLCIVIEFDTRRVLDPDKGSLFAVIAETVPLPSKGAFVGHEPPRMDWVGRPEQTNIRLNNSGMKGVEDLRDLWNQQTPFKIEEKLRPLFFQRLSDSIATWDMRDSKRDWTPSALTAVANIFLDDFMLFDVAKSITDTSHLEIEKSTLNGKPYQTGGGRTVDADVIDVLMTWMVNRDRERLQGGTTKATKPGTKNFPYFAEPNTELQTVAESIELSAAPDKVWELIGQFGGAWHPLIANIKVVGTGVGQLRVIETIDGKQIVERLDAIDNAAHSYRYSNIGGIPASNYTGMLEVKPKGSGSSVEWRSQYLPNGQGSLVVKIIVSTLFKTGLRKSQSAVLRSRMTEAMELDSEPLCTTDGEIAVINLNSARLRSWSRFFQNSQHPGIAETVIEHEQLTAQFVGDLSALDRLESLVEQLVQLDKGSARTALIQAQIASMTHRFSDARHYLAQAELGGAPAAGIKRLRMTIDQACGVNLDSVLDERRQIAKQSGRLEDQLPLGALLADLRQFADADRIYNQSLREYQDVSPFAPAWACFQLGVLWGELVPEPRKAEAANWYRRAVEYLPSYTKARVHLAEIYSAWDRMNEAEALLVPALSSGDPEVCWRLADVMAAQGKSADAEAHVLAAHRGYERLLERHPLAFADHGAEFYAGSGDNVPRALQLARINVANRPTLRAFEQAHAIAVCAGDAAAASELLQKVTKRWGGAAAFGLSSLAQHRLEGAAA